MKFRAVLPNPVTLYFILLLHSLLDAPFLSQFIHYYGVLFKTFPFHLPGLFFVLNVAWVALGECLCLLLTLGIMGCERTKKEKMSKL
jgi:uncharacterized membrane protein